MPPSRSGPAKAERGAGADVAQAREHVVVTDDDIDIFDPAQLERALAYRVQPARDIIVVEGARGSILTPASSSRSARGRWRR